MCGIISTLSKTPQPLFDVAAMKRLNDTMTHRGPDDSGIFADGPVTLAMRRLSIVDLSGGHQPICSADGKYTLVFNGEIYNHDDIRRNLMEKGYVFKTKSDTEALLYHLIEYQTTRLKDLNGMFAFALWDHDRQRLLVARDRMGEKPLYYANTPKGYIFASELTAILQSGLVEHKMCLEAISDYLAYWYVCEPLTLIEGVYQLPPGHFAYIDQKSMEMHAWWSIPTVENASLSYEETKDALRDLIEDAIKIRLKVDVPLGCFLSGGIDSGLIASMTASKTQQSLTAYGIGFKDKSYDEIALARLTARRYNIHFHPIMMPDVDAALLRQIVSGFDEPLGNASYIPSYVLAKETRQSLKVVLTGDGGDELFGGYPTYQAPYYQNFWQSLPRPLTQAIKGAVHRIPVSHGRISLDYRLKQFIKGAELDYRPAHYTWRLSANQADQRMLWKEEHQGFIKQYDPFLKVSQFFDRSSTLSVKNQLMYADLNTYLLNDHLRKVDRMTMAHGLEARLPFLDHRIVEMAMTMPASYKVNLFQTKKILKDIASDVLPGPVLKGKKKGLTSPIAGWLAGSLRDDIKELLRGGLIAHLFDGAHIDHLIEQHLSLQKDNSRLLWGLLTLQIWAEQKLNGKWYV